MISILVPVLGRPHNAQPLVSSIRSTSASDPEIVFLCSPGDEEQYVACQATGERIIPVCWEAGKADYAKKMNKGYRETASPYLLLAADDLRFHIGWDTAVLKIAERSGAGVIGTNDMGNPAVRRRKFSTHPLVRRSYIDQQGGSLDGPGVLCHEGYDHNFVDRELWDLAAHRGQTAFALNSKVEHLHPHWRKGTMDATYEKGLKDFHADQRLYWSRCKHWGVELSAREQAELKRWRQRTARLSK